tara:strand:- start:16226 stop:16966 length:741 start_codon:yes stop_codon:yes gene_type:complete
MKILVIGDLCLDKFVYGEVKRIAPEAPVPVFNPLRETTNYGMSGNVANNIKSLGINYDLVSNTDNTLIKTRYIDKDSNQMLLRIDDEDSCNGIIKDQLTNLNWKDYTAVIISDYCKGFLSEEDIYYISQKHPLTFLDTKKQLGDWCKNIKFIKINTLEYLNNKSLLNTDKELLEKIIITKGPEGCMYRNKIYPTQEVPVKDVSGAGDTFIAALVTDYITDKNIIQAINFAQKCTTIVVQKPGVATI